MECVRSTGDEHTAYALPAVEFLDEIKTGMIQPSLECVPENLTETRGLFAGKDTLCRDRSSLYRSQSMPGRARPAESASYSYVAVGGGWFAAADRMDGPLGLCAADQAAASAEVRLLFSGLLSNLSLFTGPSRGNLTHRSGQQTAC